MAALEQTLGTRILPRAKRGGGGPREAWWRGLPPLQVGPFSSGKHELPRQLCGGRPLHRLRRSPSPAAQRCAGEDTR